MHRPQRLNLHKPTSLAKILFLIKKMTKMLRQQFCQMINLQSSKKIIKKYDEMLSQTIIHANNLHSSKTNQPPYNTSRNAFQADDKRATCNDYFGRPVSKLIKIEFQQNSKSKQPEEIKLRRKIMTSSEKYYLHKKNNYYTSIKQAQQQSKSSKNQKSQDTLINLTIGSHAIQKIDYSTLIFSKDWRQKEESFSFKKRAQPKLVHVAEFNLAPKQAGKVLVLKKNNKNKLEDILLQTTNATQRSTTSTKLQKNFENMNSTIMSKNPKNYSIQQFIPLRKNTTRKQPFVFGLSQKQLNPQKNRQRLVNYQDFLWKVNYSNGLYVKPSEQDVIYKAFVGPGNNSNLVKSIIKRRYWWTIADRYQGCNFVWTQLKVNSIFKDQKPSQTKALSIYSKNAEIQNNFKTQPIACLQEGHQRIFNKIDLLHWSRHMKKHRRSQSVITDKTYKKRAQFLNGREVIRVQNSSKLNVHNHLEQNYYIGNKKSLFYHMSKFYQLQMLNVFQALPLTFHISKGLEDSLFQVFLKSFNQLQAKKRKESDIKNVWIMKPGENSNRGNGISVCYSLQDIKLRLKAKQKNSDGSLRTFIIQKYMQKPLLYKGRKFDIRHYMLLTSFNGILKAYWFPEGYIRTSSSPYTLKRGTNLLIHLTNDAVQKHAGDYGKFQKGNKVSYEKFESYLNSSLDQTKNNYFSCQILPQMKHLATQAIKSTYLSLDPQRKQYNFELLGMDFMIDEELKPWLIEINTNPCLELSCPLLSRIIPCLVQQTIRICVDPFFPPPEQWCGNKKMHIGENALDQNKFQLIFDESVDGEQVLDILGSNLGLDSQMGKIQQDAELFENDGVQEWQQKAN